jgi:hypothetical protein
MTTQTELKILQKENNKITKQINNLLNNYMMSEERDTTLNLISLLIENELQQEELCDQ